ncbi:hypothetical protein H7I76_10495, partial [Mycolicibacterium vaccae]|nr:hypothetical protein [Mycolicibacterium vaccae]
MSIVVLLAGCLAVGVLPRVAGGASAAGRRFVDSAGYLAAILGHTVAASPTGPLPGWSLTGIVLAVVGVLVAAGLPVLRCGTTAHRCDGQLRWCPGRRSQHCTAFTLARR